MSSRLRSDFWVSAYVRMCHLRGAYAVVRRRGADEAGAIFVKVDWLNGNADLYAPAPQSQVSDNAGDRTFEKRVTGDNEAVEKRLARELEFDPDVWIVEVEDRKGDAQLTLAD